MWDSQAKSSKKRMTEELSFTTRIQRHVVCVDSFPSYPITFEKKKKTPTLFKVSKTNFEEKRFVPPKVTQTERHAEPALWFLINILHF